MKSTKLIILIFVLSINFNASIAQNQPDPGTAYVPAGYSLLFSDEFNGTTLNTTTWNNLAPWGSQWYHDEKQAYVPRCVTLDSGHVTITGKPYDGLGGNAGQPYISGAITTNRTFTHGYFEARVWMPNLSKGAWNQFWLTSSTDWPPEWDIFEVVSSAPSCVFQYTHLHSGTTTTVLQGVTNSQYYGINVKDGYHIFGFEWTETTVTWFVDGVLTQKLQVSAETNDKMWLNLEQSIGGQWPTDPDATTIFPMRMYIDYVRVYSREPVVTLTSPANGVNLIAGAAVNLTATITAQGDGTVNKVEFYADKTLIGTDNNGSNGWAATWLNPTTGTYKLTAKAINTSNFSSFSPEVRVPIGQQNNLLSDPGFEEKSWDWDWWTANSGTDLTKGHTGNISIKTTVPNSGMWKAQDVQGLKPNTIYEFSGWGISSNNAFLFVKNYGGAEVNATFTDGVNWQQKKLTFKTGPSNTTVTLGAWQGAASGTSWTDDLFLVEAGITTNLDSTVFSSVYFTVYSNPANKEAIIKYNLLADNEIKIALLDILGQEVMNIVNEEQSAGEHSLTINTSSFQNGVYFIRINENGKQFSQKLIINK